MRNHNEFMGRIYIDNSVARATVCHHSAEPRDTKTVTLWTDLSNRTSHSCQILIFLHAFECQYLNKFSFTLRYTASNSKKTCIILMLL